MAIVDIYSKRQKRALGNGDVFRYDDIPSTLRFQINAIFSEFMRAEAVKLIAVNVMTIIRREHGRLHFTPRSSRDGYSAETAFWNLISEGETDLVLDAIELFLRSYPKISGSYRQGVAHESGLLKELNNRFLEAGCGYQFEEATVVRVDSKLLHKEAVKPAIVLLSEPRFAAAEAEFLKAFDHYRSGNAEEALIEACKSFESVLKVICDGKRWVYDPKATAQKLIALVLEKELIPRWMEEHFSGLRQVLTAGVPTPRNKLAGHGDGISHVPVPPYFVPYVLHLAASNIVMLIEADKALP